MNSYKQNYNVARIPIKKIWIDWLQFSLIVVLSPLFLFPSMKYIWIFSVIPLILILRFLIKKIFIEKTILDWAIFFLIMAVFVTCLIVPDLAFSLPKIAGVLFGIVFYYSIVNLLTKKKYIKYGILFFLSGGLIFSIISALGMTRYNLEYRNDLNRIYKWIPEINFNLQGAKEGFNPNAIGGTIIIFLPLFFIFAITHLQRKKQNILLYKNKLFLILLLFSLMIISIILWLTHSRGSMVAFFISIWFMLMLRTQGRKWALILVFAFIALYIISVGTNNFPAFVKDMQSKFDYRLTTWILAANKINSNPIFGIGMNQFRKHPLLHYTRSHAHNHLLHTATELGIPGLVAYIAILIGTGFMCVEILKKSNIGWIKISALGLGCGQLAHFIFGMADSIPLGAKVGIIFWISLALITAMYNYIVKKNIYLKKSNTEKMMNGY